VTPENNLTTYLLKFDNRQELSSCVESDDEFPGYPRSPKSAVFGVSHDAQRDSERLLQWKMQHNL
jgi:hypothetical protein